MHFFIPWCAINRTLATAAFVGMSCYPLWRSEEGEGHCAALPVYMNQTDIESFCTAEYPEVTQAEWTWMSSSIMYLLQQYFPKDLLLDEIKKWTIAFLQELEKVWHKQWLKSMMEGASQVTIGLLGTMGLKRVGEWFLLPGRPIASLKNPKNTESSSAPMRDLLALYLQEKRERGEEICMLPTDTGVLILDSSFRQKLTAAQHEIVQRAEASVRGTDYSSSSCALFSK